MQIIGPHLSCIESEILRLVLIYYLAINLTKKKQKSLTENYKTLLKEVMEDLSKWKGISCVWIKRLTIMRMTVLLKVIQCNSSKTFWTFWKK